MNSNYHTWAWLGWMAGMLVVFSATRNPIYLCLALLVAFIILRVMRPLAQPAPMPVSPLTFGLIVIPLSVFVNGAFVHLGRHALFTLPAWLPMVGGAITLEAIAYGFLNGVKLTGIFATFFVLNQMLPVRSLVRLIPRAFYQVAVVISIAVTYVPTTLRQFQQIREAQAIRGHRLRGWRDWLPLFVPLLVGGLERALQLAEAMIARGFASAGEPVHDTGTRLVMIQGLIALLVGWLLRLLWGQDLLGLTLMVFGFLLIAVALYVVGRRVTHTTYRQERWLSRDTVIVTGAGLAAAVFLFSIPGMDRTSIFYYPYPSLTVPGFQLGPGLVILCLALPAALRPTLPAVESGIEAEPEPAVAWRQ